MTLQGSTLGSGKQPFKPGTEFRMRPYDWPEGLLAGRWPSEIQCLWVMPKQSSGSAPKSLHKDSSGASAVFRSRD